MAPLEERVAYLEGRDRNTLWRSASFALTSVTVTFELRYVISGSK
jgi:hypothetical protein